MANNLSFWEKESFINYHHIVIGSGIVGLQTAIALKKKFPKLSVLILEMGLLPTGASTKNAGFACMGSASELLADLQHTPINDVLTLFEMRYKGLHQTRKLLGNKNIGYDANGSYELLTKNQLFVLDKLDELNKLVQPITKQKSFIKNTNIIAKNKFDKQYFSAAITNTLEGELHTGKLVKSLVQLAMQLHIEIRTGCFVSAFEENNNTINVICKTNKNEITFTANQLFICTNAFAKQLINTIDLEPGRGQVLLTKPIDKIPFKGIYHFNEGYYYFRKIENRILFGGGRNIDFKTEATIKFDTNKKIILDLETKLKQHILPNTPFTIDYNWTGIMAFGKTKMPIIKKHSNNIYLAVRCGGMGVAIGSQIAKKVVALLD